MAERICEVIQCEDPSGYAEFAVKINEFFIDGSLNNETWRNRNKGGDYSFGIQETYRGGYLLGRYLGRFDNLTLQFKAKNGKISDYQREIFYQGVIDGVNSK